MSASVKQDPKSGALLEEAVPVHFVGGPWCGITAATLEAGDVHVVSEVLRDRKRIHVYRRTGRTDGGVEILMHHQIREEGR